MKEDHNSLAGEESKYIELLGYQRIMTSWNMQWDQKDEF